MWYALFGGLWIVLSDRVLAALVTDIDTLTRLQTYKGWVFVALSALLILVLLRREVSVRRITVHQAEERLLENEERLRQIWEVTTDAMCLSDAEGRVLAANPAYFQMYGFAAEQVVGQSFEIIFPPAERENALEQYKSVFQSEQLPANFETLINRADGSERFVETHISFLTTGGRRTAMLSTIRDITDRKRAELELRHLSTHDPLTGLYNRGFFEEELSRLEHGRSYPVSILMADVDGLKQVNDRAGHAAGDALLKQAAQILTKAFRSEDVIARIGGDEFAVLLPLTDANAAKALMERVRQITHTLPDTRSQTPVSLSLGVSTAEQATSLTETLKAADTNMYSEKQRNTHSYKP